MISSIKIYHQTKLPLYQFDIKVYFIKTNLINNKADFIQTES